MRIIIQRVNHALVKVDEKIIGEIKRGLLVFVGFEESDDKDDYDWISSKIINLRIFPDEANVMNLSVEDVKADILIVSQFTLHALTKKGNRPSYIKSSPPDLALKQYQEFVNVIKNKYIRPIQMGEFGADMKVELINDGPVTIWMDSKRRE